MSNTNKKNDKRCIKTRKAIRMSLSEILKEKNIADITVKEISDHALISRNTFYAHYESVDALLDEIETEILQQIVEFVENTDVKKFQFDPYPILNELTKLIYTDFELNKHIINSKRSNNILNKLKPLSKEHVLEKILDVVNLSEEMLGILSEFYAAGINAAYKQWFNSSRTHSLEEVTTTISLVVSDGMISLLNSNPESKGK